MKTGKSGSICIVGGGIGGIQASLDLAEAGFKVILVEKSPTIGGIMSQLDKTFPTNDCAMCIMSPKLVDCARHLNIDLHTCTEIESISGIPGDFTVTIREKARYVNKERCTGCNECSLVCPVTRANAFDCGLGTRKAIYRPFPQAAPNIFTIEKKGKSPCTAACPAGCNAHGYVALIRDGKFLEAIDLVRKRIPIPAICGRVCGFCEMHCSREYVDAALQIRALKRFTADYETAHRNLDNAPSVKRTGEKIAIIGSGPAGLTAAYDLAGMGYQPVIYESLPLAGGMLRVGIPTYRLPDDILDFEIGIICKAGVEIITSSPLDDNLTVRDLMHKGFKAVFIAAGAHKSTALGIGGEELTGVIPGIDFLRNAEMGEAAARGKKVAVIGGGNTAIDAARAALRYGAVSVKILYRRTEAEMPVHKEEREAAESEGIQIHYLAVPVKITGKSGKVETLICNKMQLGFPDASGRRRPFPIEGETLTYEVDLVIPAIGQQLDSAFLEKGAPGLTYQSNLIKVDPVTLETSLPGVFAGGDAVGAGGFVVHAIAHGHEAAISIDRYLKNMDLKTNRQPKQIPVADLPAQYIERQPAVRIRTADTEKRRTSFTEVELGFSEEEAVQEARRCLDCGVCCECHQCVTACKAEAIDHFMEDDVFRIKSGAVLLAPGCELTDARHLYKLGFGKYADVLTSIQFERILSASGPLGGHIRRLSDHKPPRKIAFIQCAGSRDPALGNTHCSSVCCMYAIKEAIIAKEHMKSVEPTIFYMDIRAHGKDFERFYKRAVNDYGIQFKKARVSGVFREPGADALSIQFENEAGLVEKENFDLVILSIGFQGNGQLRELGEKLALPLNRFGFIASDTFFPIQSKVPGVFLFGPAQEPRDIPETVMQASAAAAAASEILAANRFTEVKAKEYPPETDVTGQEPRIGVFVCHCGINIGGTVKVPEVTAYAQTLPHVVYAEENLYTCSQDTQEHIKEIIIREKLNRVIVASCTPRTHEPLFQETIREAGLNRHLFTMANIRDQCSWIHMHYPEEATRKACDLVRMAAAKTCLLESLPRMPLPVTQRALVIGGGAAGMAAALSLADQGFDVDLVEKEQELGGNLLKVLSTIEGEHTNLLLETFKTAITENSRIRTHLAAALVSVEGFVGNFKTRIRTEEAEIEIAHGIAVIATGARESVPAEYGYGADKRIVTNLDFEKILADTSNDTLPEQVVFIQCVGSRDAEHATCSRICCKESIKNAIALKKRNPRAEVYILYRDMRTYGFSEFYYQEARDLGILFLRYTEDNQPCLTLKENAIRVSLADLYLNRVLQWQTQLIVLAARIDPHPGNEALSQLFKVPLNADRFFLEAHVKLRPVDFATEGVFLAGMAHSPKSIAESITQGKAAAGRAAAILSRDKYEAEATIAAVNEDLCDGCAVCINVCEYKALEVIEKTAGKKIVQLNEAVCKGCGGCVAACPSGAMEQKGFKNEQILAEIDAALM